MRMLTRRQWLYLGIGLVLMVLCGPISNWLGAQRVARGMTPGRNKQGVDPSTFVGTSVLAGFRPLAVNYLWVKANGLQQSREYWELRSVYELLSKLQPTNPDVWVFNAWNMSYNISVEMANTDDAWRWVLAGIDFIQRGRKNLPESELIHTFEAQLFYQKIWQLPWLRERVRVKWGKSALELALEANDRAFQRKHGSPTCLGRRAILMRMARVAVIEGGDLVTARRLLARVDALSQHIMSGHPIEMYLRPTVLRDELRSTAGFAMHALFRGLRDQMGRQIAPGRTQPADWEPRWRQVVGLLDRVAATYELLEGQVQADRKSFRQQIKERIGRHEDAPTQMALLGLAAAGERYFEDWLRFARVMRDATRAQKAWQDLVPAMYRLPIHERQAYRASRILRRLRKTFRVPLSKASRQTANRSLQRELKELAAGTSF